MRAWDSFCRNCGSYIPGISMVRQGTGRKVLPYCHKCGRYALHEVHAAVLAPLAAAAFYLLLVFLESIT